MTGKILVVGATLVDFIGTYPSHEAGLKNRTGQVRVSIGGSAFNVAADLVSKGFETHLFTYCHKESVVGLLIKNACKSIGLKDLTVHSDDHAYEPAYVALMRDGEIDTGVACSPIENTSLLDDPALRKAVRHADLVALETNLSTDQIRGIVELCQEYSKRVCCMVVSDAKAHRIHNQDFAKKFELISMNTDEAKQIGFSRTDLNEISRAQQVLLETGAENALVSAGADGSLLIQSGETKAGGMKRYPCPEISGQPHTLGAGDAMFAAACASLLSGETLDSPHTEERIRTWVREVIEREEANLAKVRLSATKAGADH